MTLAEPETRPRHRRADALYKTEAEIAQEVGVSPSEWRRIALMLEPQGLPRRDPMFCNRRFWPAVERYLLRRHGLVQTKPPPIPDGEEDPDYVRTRRRSRP